MRGEGGREHNTLLSASKPCIADTFKRKRFDGNHPPSGTESRTSETGYH